MAGVSVYKYYKTKLFFSTEQSYFKDKFFKVETYKYSILKEKYIKIK